jgi:hypothetical protein
MTLRIIGNWFVGYASDERAARPNAARPRSMAAAVTLEPAMHFSYDEAA